MAYHVHTFLKLSKHLEFTHSKEISAVSLYDDVSSNGPPTTCDGLCGISRKCTRICTTNTIVVKSRYQICGACVSGSNHEITELTSWNQTSIIGSHKAIFLRIWVKVKVSGLYWAFNDHVTPSRLKYRRPCRVIFILGWIHYACNPSFKVPSSNTWE